MNTFSRNSNMWFRGHRKALNNCLPTSVGTESWWHLLGITIPFLLPAHMHERSTPVLPILSTFTVYTCPYTHTFFSLSLVRELADRAAQYTPYLFICLKWYSFTTFSLVQKCKNIIQISILSLKICLCFKVFVIYK